MDIKCAIVVDGTRGDIQPYTTLGMRLQAEGFEVRIVTNSNHAVFAQSFGLACDGVGANLEEKFKDKASLGASFKNGPPGFAKYLWGDSVGPTWKALDAFKPDLVVYNMTTIFMTCAWAEANRVPAVAAMLQQLVPTCEYAPAWYAPQRPYKGKLESENDYWASWETFFQGWCDQKHCEMIKEAIANTTCSVTSENCPKMLTWDDHQEFMKVFQNPSAPMIFGVSELATATPKPKDYTDHHHIVGFFTMEAATQVDKNVADFFGSIEELESFIRKGPPPVYFGWGSMTASIDAKVAVTKAVTALKATEQRGILVGGWGDLVLENLEDVDLRAYAEQCVLFVSHAPHEWLFPQCSCIVHHGGCGTTAASMRSGRPTVVTPVATSMDQPQWAASVNKLGVGVGVESLSKVTSEELAAAVSRCFDEEVKAKAAEIGEKLQAEDGAQQAVVVIKQFIAEVP